FAPKPAELISKPEVSKVKIVFLLTLNGRALRQVHRLIKSLYKAEHFFYIHIDSCMRDLYDLRDQWNWDFIINLSESDYPIKKVEKLQDFLTANHGMNFVKSHGRETQRFIQKQGLDKTFVECDIHMWRIGDRTLPEGIQVDGGSDWVALSKNFVEFILDIEGNNELIQGLLIIFRHTLLPAESFFHTVLRNSKFCGTYIDNNLHITNWKRKLGCKCQYKHVVDWCGCSPNDFKPEDWPRLEG
uniref:protein xylosyltransferase n=1 Tax=Megaselia scalaris TaxID=36166 RepID=T1H3G5_MEGSC